MKQVFNVLIWLFSSSVHCDELGVLSEERMIEISKAVRISGRESENV